MDATSIPKMRGHGVEGREEGVDLLGVLYAARLARVVAAAFNGGAAATRSDVPRALQHRAASRICPTSWA
jgi:hypothetical protein